MANFKPTEAQLKKMKAAQAAITKAENAYKAAMLAPYKHLVGKPFNGGDYYGVGVVTGLKVGHVYNAMASHCHLDVELVVEFQADPERPHRSNTVLYNADGHNGKVQLD